MDREQFRKAGYAAIDRYAAPNALQRTLLKLRAKRLRLL